MTLSDPAAVSASLRGPITMHYPPRLPLAAALAAVALAGSASATLVLQDSPVDAAASQDATAEIIDAASRLETDPVFEAPPEEIPAVEGGELVVFEHPGGMVARRGHLVDGQRAGIWISWHPSGVRATLGAYRDYGRVGPWVITRPDGARNEGSYGERGRKQGLWRSYFPNGSLREREFWKDGRQVGTLERFNPQGNRVQATCFLNGQRHGAHSRFSADGRVTVEEGSYFKGGADGDWVYRHLNGRTAAEGAYSVGQKTGSWMEYHANGQKRLAGGYDARGRRTGEWRGFSKRGAREFVATFVDGELDGPYVQYWPSGDKRGEGSYQKGQLHGPWSFWTQDGIVDAVRTGTYREGTLLR